MTSSIKSNRTWQDNAQEFGSIERGEGGWTLATLVACSVGEAKFGKVSAAEFAQIAGVSPTNIVTYLRSWDLAIKAGAKVPPATELSPTDVGTFPLPAKPFNGPNGFVKTRTGSAASGTVETTVASVIKGKNQLTQGLASSSAAMTRLIEAAAKGPKVIETVIAEMDDKSFEVLSEAITAAVTPAPAVVTSSGVKPAYVPSVNKQKVFDKAAGKVAEVKHKEFVKKLIDSAPPKTNPKPDGQVSPVVEQVQNLLAGDQLFDTEVVIAWLKRTHEAVLNYPGPLSEIDEEFMVERTGIMSGLIAQILEAIEAKKGSKVPDTVPDSWN